MTLPSLQHTAGERPYPERVKHARPTVGKTLADNLKALMQRRDWSQAQLADKSGVSQRHISNVLRAQTSSSVESVDALANAFGLPGWLLLIPGLDVTLMDGPLIPRLVSFYRGAGPEGRELIERLAERESHHNASTEKILPFQKPKAR
jgi:transcriptional regulator with XRE-family HTH domain